MVYRTGSIALAFLAAAIVAGLFGLLFAYVTVTLQANQIVTGTALNLIGLGLSSFVNRVVFGGCLRPHRISEPVSIPF